MNIMFTTKYLAVAALVFLLLPAWGFAESAQSKIDAGISHYKQQEYKEAVENFLSAQVEEPDNAALAYNLANSNYKSGKFAEAIQTYSRAVASVSDPALKQKASYNIGNSLFRLGKLDEAVGAYKKALELNPDDMDAKFNLEFTRQQLKKQKQRKEENQKKRDRDASENKNEQSQSDPDNQDQENPEERQPEEQNPKEDQADQDKERPENQNNKQKSGQNSATAQADPQEGEMTREEAEQWLRSLKENLKKISQKQIREHAANPEYKGKDW